jgi:hypothetical protein
MHCLLNEPQDPARVFLGRAPYLAIWDHPTIIIDARRRPLPVEAITSVRVLRRAQGAPHGHCTFSAESGDVGIIPSLYHLCPIPMYDTNMNVLIFYDLKQNLFYFILFVHVNTNYLYFFRLSMNSLWVLTTVTGWPESRRAVQNLSTDDTGRPSM